MVMAAPTLEPVADQTLLLGAPLHVPLDGFDADLDVLSYSVSSNNADIIAELRQGNRSMRIHVEHVGDGTPADPSFSGDLVFELFEDLGPKHHGAHHPVDPMPVLQRHHFSPRGR